MAKRAFFLAWIACGGPIGLGALRNKGGATEEEVWQNVMMAGDYPARPREKEEGAACGDYVFGRMMKLNLRYGPDWVDVPDYEPRADYQSWCQKYRTYSELIEAAIGQLSAQAA